MKKIYILIFVLASLQASAQCVPMSSNTPGVYPHALVQGCQNVSYTDTITIIHPQDTTLNVPPIGVLTIPFDSIEFYTVADLPQGLVYSCNTPNCITVGNPPTRISSCLLINGTPTDTTGLNDSVTITERMWLSVFGSPTPIFNSYKVALKISSCAGIAGIIDNGFKVYPNPANNSISIDFNLQNNAPVRFSLINALGQVVISKSLDNLNNQIDITTIGNGMYMYQLETETGLITNKLFVIK